MYANLRVRIGRKPLPLNSAGTPQYDETVSAFNVHIGDGGGHAAIFVDGSDGEGFAVPAGMRYVDLSLYEVAIEADF